MLDKMCKLMYQPSNKNVDYFLLHLMRCEQTLAFVTAENDATEMLRKAGFLGPNDELLDATAGGQAAVDREFMDGVDPRVPGIRHSGPWKVSGRQLGGRPADCAGTGGLAGDHHDRRGEPVGSHEGDRRRVRDGSSPPELAGGLEDGQPKTQTPRAAEKANSRVRRPRRSR